MAASSPHNGMIPKVTGLVIGLVAGGVMGPALFNRFGLHDAAASAVGTVAGAVCGYVVITIALLIRQWRRDRELLLAAEAIRKEANLPEHLKIKVVDGVVIVTGEVDRYSERQRVEAALSTLPGIAGIRNQIRLLRGNTQLSAEDIKRQIELFLLREAKLDGRGIRVVVDNSRVILEGTVHSWAEASEAEEIAWNTPGIAQVENRLEAAA